MKRNRSADEIQMEKKIKRKRKIHKRIITIIVAVLLLLTVNVPDFFRANFGTTVLGILDLLFIIMIVWSLISILINALLLSSSEKKNSNTERKPEQKLQTKPVQTKPVQTKPVQAKPVQAKPVQTKSVQTKRSQSAHITSGTDALITELAVEDILEDTAKELRETAIVEDQESLKSEVEKIMREESGI